MKAVPLV